MGGKATNEGTDFQARVTAYIAAHLLAKQKLKGWSPAPGSVPNALHLEQDTSGDDIRVELADGGYLEVQAKHGLNATKRLTDALARFAAKLKDDEHPVIAVDRAESSGTIQNELRELLEQWRDGRGDVPITDGLKKKIGVLLDPNHVALKERLRVAALDVDDDYLDGARYAVQLLRGQLLREEDAEAAWAILIQDAQYVAKKGGRRDRARYREVLLDKGIHLRDVEQARLGAAPSTAAPGVAEITLEVEAELEPVATLIRAYQPAAAIALLDAEKAGGARALHLRGLAMLMLGKYAEARELLHEALDADPSRTGVLTHLAAAEQESGNTARVRELLTEATTSRPGDASVWAARLHLVGDIEIEDVPEGLRAHPEVLVASAIKRLERGDAREAVAEIRTALEVGRDPSRLLHLAQALRIQAADEPAPLGEQLLDESLTLLDEADALLPDKQTDTAKGAQWGRALSLEGLGKLRDALDAYQVLATSGPLSWEQAGRFASLALATSYRVDDALAAVNGASAADEMARDATRVRILVGLGRRDEATEALKRAAEVPVAGAAPEARVALALAALELDDPEVAKQALSGMDEADPRVCVLGARSAIQLGDHIEAMRMFDAAVDVAFGEDERGIRLEYAWYQHTQRDFARVVDLLSPLDEARDQGVAQLKAQALYNIGDFAGAYQVVTRASVSDAAPTWALRMGSTIALRRHDFDGAEKWLDRWLDQDAQALEAVIWRAQLHLQRGENDAARSVLGEEDFRTETPHLRMRRAFLLLQVDEVEESMDTALSVLREAVDDGHLQYMYFLISAMAGDRKAGESRDAVDIGAYVVLRDDDGTDWEYVIVAGNAVPSFDEISKDEPLAERLVGAAVGEKIQFRDVEPRRDATIVEIAGQHTHAFRWTAARQQKQEPTAPRVWSVPVPSTEEGTDFSAIEQLVHQKAKHEAEILSAVEQKVLPLGFAEKQLGLTTPQVYGAISEDIDRRLMVEVIDPRDGTAAARAGRCVLTRSALLTIQVLGCFDLVESLTTEILVPPNLMIELRQEEAEHKEVARKGRTSMGVRNGQPVLFEATPADGAALLARHQALVTWVEKVGVSKPRPFDWESRREPVWDGVSDSSFDAAIVAAAEDAPIFADDLGLRMLAHHKLSVSGFSTYALLKAAADDGRFDDARYHMLLSQLLVIGHAHVAPTIEAVRLAMDEGEDWPSRALARVLIHLRGPHVDLAAGARFVAQVIRLAILNHPLRDFRPVADLAFESIFHGRDPDNVERMLRRAVQLDLLLIPQKDDVLEAVAHFRAVRLGGSSLWTP
ncbi:MAG: tetratricopeptide repeat protein [Sandaracinaceae bacterium]